LDLNEHTLTEAQRTLKRLGITHLLRPPIAAQEDTPPAPAAPQAAPQPQPPLQSQAAQKPAAQANEPLPLLLRSLFHGKQSPVRTMWCYAGLYRDLQEATNPPRLVVFKKIQESVCQHLHWQIKDICSWPTDLDLGAFRQGFDFFNPGIILLFQTDETGHEQSSSLDAHLLKQTTRRVVTLPSLDEMARGNQHVKNEAWKILQTV
jgi:hypothetical protein